ncbi:hypothetical protein BCR42DRAFT_401048 [Absidia repens]|uniref:Uncharacterized protein n=1 Tax=Absidia repens TaxID=90262 RepID=A0A1X2J226_9FUNG|nr:hypothetical protein BCR42DRAFT_401048 [Absidia repens]
MTMFSRHFKSFVIEVPKPPSTPRKNKHHLQVSISSEPPTILYFEQSKDEQECECIFDPLVQHDDEKDHPDLIVSKKQDDLKAWQKPPYCKVSTSSNGTFFKRVLSNMRVKSQPSPSPCVLE